MKNERLESENEDGAEAKEQRNLQVDWTESEWFAVWLRLARGEYQGTAAEGTAAC